jgi:hypothetical protein
MLKNNLHDTNIIIDIYIFVSYNEIKRGEYICHMKKNIILQIQKRF